jgi:hypothetical protein
MQARGLSKKSWFMLAAKMGLPVNAPGYVKKAIARTGKSYPQNYSVTRNENKNSLTFEFVNNQPTVQFEEAGGYSALRRALAGRVKFFQNNMKTGVFQSAAAIAKKYKGIYLT